jgi:hypothetical protein
MLDDVERRRILEQPAGKDPQPLRRCARCTALGDEHLHEGAGFGRRFPGRGPLAAGQPDDHIPHAARFARLYLDILREIVTLVEQADGGDAILQRRTKFGARDWNGCFESGQFLGNFRFFRLRNGWLLRTASQRRERRKDKQCPGAGPGTPHDQESGVHAS